jgi:hypothetical protein
LTYHNKIDKDIFALGTASTIMSLDELFSKQQELIDIIKSDKPDFWGPEKFEGERIFRLCSFLIHEAVELQQENIGRH